MRRTVLVALAVLIPATSHATCEEPVSAAALKASLTTAESAFAKVDVDAFQASMATARAQLGCMGEAISPPLAARLHRLEGLAAFADSARDQAAAAFAAARRLEPDAQLSTDVVPEGNPIHDVYQQQDTECEEETLPPAKKGKVQIDGSTQRKAPAELPAIVQVLDPKGGERVTQYRWPGEPITYTAGSIRTPLQNGLLAGGAALAAVGLGTVLVGQTSTGTTTNDFPADILDASRQRSTLTGTGAGLLGAGLMGIGVSFALPGKEAY